MIERIQRAIFDLADELKELFRKTIGNFCPDANRLGLSLAVGDDPIFILLLDYGHAFVSFFQDFLLYSEGFSHRIHPSKGSFCRFGKA